MKHMLVYWCIGCAVVGFPLGGLINECPNAKFEWREMAAGVAIWPTIIAAALVVKPGRKTSCEATP